MSVKGLIDGGKSVGGGRRTASFGWVPAVAIGAGVETGDEELHALVELRKLQRSLRRCGLACCTTRIGAFVVQRLLLMLLLGRSDALVILDLLGRRGCPQTAVVDGTLLRWRLRI